MDNSESFSSRWTFPASLDGFLSWATIHLSTCPSATRMSRQAGGLWFAAFSHMSSPIMKSSCSKAKQQKWSRSSSAWWPQHTGVLSLLRRDLSCPFQIIILFSCSLDCTPLYFFFQTLSITRTNSCVTTVAPERKWKSGINTLSVPSYLLEQPCLSATPPVPKLHGIYFTMS